MKLKTIVWIIVVLLVLYWLFKQNYLSGITDMAQNLISNGK